MTWVHVTPSGSVTDDDANEIGLVRSIEVTYEPYRGTAVLEIELTDIEGFAQSIGAWKKGLTIRVVDESA